ncbi:iron ABC transporter permease [Azospirillum sp. HJ39]|uniref:FecCD family ABC transporter permease n=1 Tax=Azospirillum sp. HJ39 TaxID=3159496 RepID=UPI003557B959
MSRAHPPVLVWRAGALSVRLPVRPALAAAGLSLALALLAFWALGRGSEPIPAREILGYLGLGDAVPDEGRRLVLSAFRAPRVWLAMLCGAMLALAGATMQALTRNGLADPGLMGVREGAALCVVTLLLLLPGTPLWWRPVAGLCGGLAVGALVLLLARAGSGLRLVLVGIGVSWCLSAVLAILLAAAETRNLQAAMLWLAGNIQAADWPMVRLAALLTAAGGGLLLLSSPGAEARLLGDSLAVSLGTRLRAVTVAQFLVALFLVAGAVSVAGGLGFVGLIAPHLARALPAGSPRARLIGTGLIGAMLVLLADTIGRSAFAPVELPTGVVLAAVGAPTLILLLWTRRNQL